MKIKLPKLITRKKLRASTSARRRSLRASAEATYDDMSEPNMKLSRALLIVLVLHIVAVSGIVAFNAIKTRQGSFVPRSSTSATVADVASKPQPENTPLKESASPQPPPKSVTRDQPKIDHTRSSEHETAPLDSGKIYVVVRGDNPVTIAKKFKVSYDDLIQLNHIDDPRKLRIGTKLMIPRPLKTKKNEQ